jgi:hypothetical protein
MTNDPADIIISYFDSHGINDARAGAFNILDRLKQAGFIVRLAAQADAPGGQPQSPADVTDAHKHVMQAIKELHEASIPVPMSLHHAAHALHYADTRPDRGGK